MARKKVKSTSPLVDLDLNTLQPKSDFASKPLLRQAKGICVVLEDDFKKDDLEAIMEAIRQLKKVAVVKYIDFDGFHDYPNRTRVKLELRAQLKEILDLEG